MSTDQVTERQKEREARRSQRQSANDATSSIQQIVSLDIKENSSLACSESDCQVLVEALRFILHLNQLDAEQSTILSRMLGKLKTIDKDTIIADVERAHLANLNEKGVDILMLSPAARAGLELAVPGDDDNEEHATSTIEDSCVIDMLHALMRNMAETTAPPNKFDDSWRFLSDDEDYDELPSLGEDVITLSQLSELARVLLSRYNRSRRVSYQTNTITATVWKQRYYGEDDDTHSQALTTFFHDSDMWKYEGTLYQHSLTFTLP